MLELPVKDNTLLVRADFSNDLQWQELLRIIEDPNAEFRAYVEIIDDRTLADRSTADLLALLPENHHYPVIFIVDRQTIQHPELPILAIDLLHEVGRTIRVIPQELWGIENNLSIANMDFAEFANGISPDGIYRGLPQS
jgi:hypothetical protein